MNDARMEVTLILCADVTTARDGSIKTLSIVCGPLMLPELPASLGKLYMRVLSPDDAIRRFRLELHRPDRTGQRSEFAGWERPTSKAHEAAIPLGAFEVREPGVHRFVLFADDEPIATHTFEVVHGRPAGPN